MKTGILLAPSIAKSESALRELTERMNNLDSIIDTRISEIIHEKRINPNVHKETLDKIRADLLRMYTKEISDQINIIRAEIIAMQTASEIDEDLI